LRCPSGCVVAESTAWRFNAGLLALGTGWLDRTLVPLPYSAPLRLRDPIAAASLPAVRPRARLADEMGDPKGMLMFRAFPPV
jgi:hypothetical protein